MEQTSITTAAVDLYAHVLNAIKNSKKTEQETAFIVIPSLHNSLVQDVILQLDHMTTTQHYT